jgi:pantothenate kinase type III
MTAGVYLGVQGEMMQFIESATNRYDNLMIISTGGDFNLFEKAFKNIIFAHPYLTLEGLYEILKFNNV